MRLTAENITKSFGAKQVLKGIDLAWRAGARSACSGETERAKQP